MVELPLEQKWSKYSRQTKRPTTNLIVSLCYSLVPRTGLEPVQPEGREILSLLCLPIPPPGHGESGFVVWSTGSRQPSSAGAGKNPESRPADSGNHSCGPGKAQSVRQARIEISMAASFHPFSKKQYRCTTCKSLCTHSSRPCTDLGKNAATASHNE